MPCENDTFTGSTLLEKVNLSEDKQECYYIMGMIWVADWLSVPCALGGLQPVTLVSYSCVLQQPNWGVGMVWQNSPIRDITGLHLLCKLQSVPVQDTLERDEVCISIN